MHDSPDPETLQGRIVALETLVQQLIVKTALDKSEDSPIAFVDRLRGATFGNLENLRKVTPVDLYFPDKTLEHAYKSLETLFAYARKKVVRATR